MASCCSFLLSVLANLICIFLVSRQLVIISVLPKFLYSFYLRTRPIRMWRAQRCVCFNFTALFVRYVSGDWYLDRLWAYINNGVWSANLSFGHRNIWNCQVTFFRTNSGLYAAECRNWTAISRLFCAVYTRNTARFQWLIK